jgi:hypothetical protein
MTITIAPFPKSILSPLDCSSGSVPDNTSITLLEKELYANAKSIYSRLGTGVHGHLFLVTNAPTYMRLTGAPAPAVLPVNPSAQPVFPPAATDKILKCTGQQHANPDRISSGIGGPGVMTILSHELVV